MGTITMIAQVILALSILIVFHEWGHFQTARWFGIKVEKFYLFFDAYKIKLFKFVKGDTEYGIGWLPLGGYVKIAGMIDESNDKEYLNKKPEPWEFRSKPAWQRLIVMIGGVTVNIVLGVLIYTGIKYVYGESFHKMEDVKHGIVAYDLGKESGFETGDKILKVNGVAPERFADCLNPEVLINSGTYTIQRGEEVLTIKLAEDFAEKMKDSPFIGIQTLLEIDEVIPGSHAAEAGLLKGDIIRQINDSSVQYFHQVGPFLKRRIGETIQVEVDRGGQMAQLSIEVAGEKEKSPGTIGFRPKNNISYEKLGLGASFTKGSAAAFTLLSVNIKALGKVFTGKLNPAKTVSGPIGIATMFGSEWNWQRFWTLTGALSMILAFMNVLPVPALDGGHIIFLLIEIIRGKPFSDKVLTVSQMIGFYILITLMALIFGNDIYQAIVS